MPDYLLHLSPWLFACFLVGAATGAKSSRAPEKLVARWFVWVSLAFIVGLLVAGLGALRGGAGAMLESALAFFATFLIGAAAASFAAEHSWRRHEGWVLGLLPVALIWILATCVALPGYERELRQRAAALAVKAGEDSSGLAIAGRDLTLTPSIWKNAKLVRELHELGGVRKLLEPAGQGDAAAERVEKERGDDASAPGRRPTEPRAVLAALPAGELSLSDCEAALTATAAVDPITFREASAVIRRDAALALDKAATFIRRCPDAPIEVIGRADAVGGEAENSELSLRRAEAAARYLRREGVSGRRLIVAGYGAEHPVAPNSDEAGRARNRSISLSVKPTM